MSNRAALRRVLAFGLNGNRVSAEDVQLAFGKGLLEELAAFGRGRDGVKHAGVGDARLSVVRDELVPVGGDADAWVASLHGSLTVFLVSLGFCLRSWIAFLDQNARPLSLASGPSRAGHSRNRSLPAGQAASPHANSKLFPNVSAAPGNEEIAGEACSSKQRGPCSVCAR